MSKNKILWWTLGIAAVGTAGVLAYRQYAKMNQKGSSLLDNLFADKTLPEATPNTSESITPVVTTPVYQPPVYKAPAYSLIKTTSSDEFPLKQGSRGPKVKEIQLALIRRNITVPGGADGIFGKGTAGALKQAGFDQVIDETLYNIIIQKASVDPGAVSNSIQRAIVAKDFNKALAETKKIKSKEEYSRVNDLFKESRFLGYRHTLVTALLKTFTKQNEKEKFQTAFRDMGLKYNGDTWSLGGIEAPKIITTTPTLVWKDQHTSAPVAANIILGFPITSHGGYTLFKNIQGQQFLVPTHSIKLL